MPEYLYNSRGRWIAFRLGDNVYDADGHWFGWVPWPNGDVYDRDGLYLASIVGDRLYHDEYRRSDDFPGNSGTQPDAGEDAAYSPGFAPVAPLPWNMSDVAL